MASISIAHLYQTNMEDNGSILWYPLRITFETTLGLEDYAEESILDSLHDDFKKVPNFLVDANISSGYVTVAFSNLAGDAVPPALLHTLRLYVEGRIPAARAAFICIEEHLVNEETRAALGEAWRNEDLRKNAEVRRSERRQHWGSRPGADDRPKGRTSHENAARAPLSEPEQTILSTITSMIKDNRERLSAALKLVCPEPKHYTFRGSLSNPQHMVPFPFLRSRVIEKAVGEETAKWLDSCEVENRQDWEALCQKVNPGGGSRERPGRLWKVDLDDAEVEIGLHLITVPSHPHERDLHRPGELPLYPPQEPRQQFPSTIRMLSLMKIPRQEGIVPKYSGKTALSSVTAHLLTTILPPFSPFVRGTVDGTVVMMDPCGGTGAIPRELARIAQRRSVEALVLSGDFVLANVEASVNDVELQRLGVEGMVWTAQGGQGGVRDRALDGIVSDLPWGHREGTPRLIEKLYPKMLNTFGRMVRIGGYAVLTTSGRPLMKRCLARCAFWEEVAVGGVDGAAGDREVWIGGMRASVFLLRRKPT